MGLLLSVIISYAGVREAIDCFRHILSGMLPEDDPDFQDIVDYYTKLLQKPANPSTSVDWTAECGQGYLCLSEDKNGKLKSAAVKYYGSPNSTAILFSTKISSFGQDTIDEDGSQPNGDYRSERYSPARTKTIISNTSDSISVGNRNRSPSASETVSDPPLFLENSFEGKTAERTDDDSEEKITWHYRPKSPVPPTLPEIHFQSFDDDKKGVPLVSEEFLRSLDGIKFRPLQRNDPSGRRRSFKKRNSSSSTSSRESRASREEELKLFTSLEEAEFERMSAEHVGGSAPNLAARSYSRSRSRENSKERKNESWSVDASMDSVDAADDNTTELKPRIKDMPKLGSFEEEKEDKEETKETEVTTPEEEDDLDNFWGNDD